MLLRQGRLAEAEKGYRSILQADGNHFVAMHELGVLYLQSGRIEVAVRLLQDAAERNPGSAMFHNDVAVALGVAKRFDEAIEAYKRCIAIEPQAAQSYCNLGHILHGLGRDEEALVALQKAVELEPRSIEAQSNLGLVLMALDRFEEAQDCHNKAIALAPGMPEPHNNLGETLVALGQLEQAAQCFNRAFTIVPGFSPAHYNYGNAMMTLGRSEDARRAFENALRFAPGVLTCHLALSQTKKFYKGDPQIAQLEVLAKDETSLSDSERADLHFALHKVYVDLERHELAFEHLTTGNIFKRRTVAYDEATQVGVMQGIAVAFTPELMRAKSGIGNPSEVPVFIVGMPRSGTTLVEQILASHPDVFGAGEVRDFSRAVNREGLDAILQFGADKLTEDDLRRLGGRYLAQILPKAPEAKRITNKMLANFRSAALIHLALPKARIIHVRRDPLDTCFSCYSISFQNGLDFTYDLGELGRYYKAYEALMAHWRAVLPEGAMLEVQYETLVENFETEVRRIIDYCGLDWDERCLTFYKAKRPVQTASALQVRQPLYRSSIGRWQPYREQLRPLIEALGIDPD